MRDEFRSIVYGYMSRVRRADGELHFPERKVQLHAVDPSPQELALIETIKKYLPKAPKTLKTLATKLELV